MNGKKNQMKKPAGEFACRLLDYIKYIDKKRFD